MTEISRKFDFLCDKAMREFDESFESSLIDILNFVKSHPEAKDEFVEKFKEIVNESKSKPFEAVSFCMRELRWPEIRSYIESEINSSPGRHELLVSALAAYDDEWSDHDLYKYYSSGGNVAG